MREILFKAKRVKDGEWITVMQSEEIMAIVIVIWDSMSMKENVLK